MLQINPKKFRHIQNKAIPSPLRPKFRNSKETNIYFLSKRKAEGEKKDLKNKRILFFISTILFITTIYYLTN